MKSGNGDKSCHGSGQPMLRPQHGQQHHQQSAEYGVDEQQTIKQRRADPAITFIAVMVVVRKDIKQKMRHECHRPGHKRLADA